MKKIISLIIAAAAAITASAFSCDTIKVATKHLGSPEDVVVITPDGPGGKKYPSVYLLNGFGGDHTGWTTTQPRLGEIADTYGMVMVIPDGRDSWYWDSPVDPSMQMESFIIKDLVPYIDSHYPTVADASKRAITGLSMGGHGALNLAVEHPDVFRSAGSTSGGVDIRPFPKRWKMAQRIGEKNGDNWDKYTVATKIQKFKDAGLNIIFDCGFSDFFADVNENFHRDLKAAGVPHDYISRPGNHSHPYWANAILYHLLYFNEVFNRK